jgi:hypothetical protein
MPNQIVVVGHKSESRVFKKAILLSSSKNDIRNRSNYYPCKEVRNHLRYDKALNRSSLRIFQEEGLSNSFKKYLDRQS